MEWFRKAVEKGYGDAQYALGTCYQEGFGVEKDMEKAVEWYRKAEQGSKDAHNALKRLGK
ncbi:MAG: sel1 repeat family protein [Victivallales bacterium]|nr:sel1 repeat family protein [Victivallales bacterium]